LPRLQPYQRAAAFAALNDPELVKRRKGVASVDNAFLMFSEEKMLAMVGFTS
jgi:hypothetical protein